MKKLLFILAATTISSGCSVGSKYKHIETDSPKVWENSDKNTQDKNSALSQEWWKEFHSDKLTALMGEAQNSNYDIKSAIARVKQADAQVRVAGASLFPEIDASGGVLRTGGKSATANSYNGSLSASYEIDFWGKNRAAKESAKALAGASRFDKQTVALTVSSNVATTYLNILAASDRLKAGENNLANTKKLLDAIRKRFDQGLATALDVAQQENEAATQEAALPGLKQQIQQNKNALAILLGKMPESFEGVSEEKGLDGLSAPVVVPGLPSELLQRRPDVQVAEANLIAANADITNARAAMFPNIALTASGGYTSGAFSALFEPGSALWSLGGSIAQPIFMGGALKGQLDFSKARYDELLNAYHQSVILAFSDVENALVAVEQTEATEKAQNEAQRTARNAYDLSQKQFSGGVIDIITVLNTQRVLFSAEDAYIQAKLAHLQAIVGLYRALGGGWQMQDIVEKK
jgi:multidrug efflux system outer membrane protein